MDTKASHNTIFKQQHLAMYRASADMYPESRYPARLSPQNSSQPPRLALSSSSTLFESLLGID
jgi:hypothetical protein